MAYWRWRAYDNQVQESSGVMEEQRYELVAIKLIQQSLNPASIERINFEEYKRFKPLQLRLDNLTRTREKLSPKSEIPITSPDSFSKSFWRLILLVASCLLIYLAYRYSAPLYQQIEQLIGR